MWLKSTSSIYWEKNLNLKKRTSELKFINIRLSWHHETQRFPQPVCKPVIFKWKRSKKNRFYSCCLPTLCLVKAQDITQWLFLLLSRRTLIKSYIFFISSSTGGHCWKYINFGREHRKSVTGEKEPLSK